MRYNVITVARTLGAGGEGLGERLADELGFRYVDDEIIDRAAALAGVTPAEIAEVEARPGLVGRVMAALLGAGSAPARRASAPPGAVAPGYEQLIVDVIKETAAMEFVVIVAHGAAVPLAGTPGVLRMLVTASTEIRSGRIAAEQGITAGAAGKLVEASDQARADFFRRFYELAREEPTLYDLVVNTDVLSIDDAATAILTLIRG